LGGPWVAQGPPNPRPKQAEGRNPEMEKPGLKPGVKIKKPQNQVKRLNNLWSAAALGCGI
jgi:hypothetical protein